MKHGKMAVLVAVIGLAGAWMRASGQPPVLELSVEDRVRVSDHDNGIYVAGTLRGDLYVLEEAGGHTVISAPGNGQVEHVSIEYPHMAVATGTTVTQYLLTGTTAAEQWSMNLGEELRSVDISADGRYISYLGGGWYDQDIEMPGSVGVLEGPTIAARYDLLGDSDPIYCMDATSDMEYIAVTDEPSPPGPDGEATGVELFRFDDSGPQPTLTRVWGTPLMNDYETTEIRISESKDWIAAGTSSGVYMDLLDMTDGALMWEHETPGKEQFACDGDENLEYVIGACQAWWRPYPWFVLKNNGNDVVPYDVIAEGEMDGPINDLDSNRDASLLAFGSDLGEWLLLRRTGDVVEIAGEGNVGGIIDAIEVGDQSLLIAGDGFIMILPEPGTLLLLAAGAGCVALRRRR